MEIDQISPALVSRMAKDLDDQVQEFFVRPIERPIPYLYVDASYLQGCGRKFDTSPKQS
ncbi:transposase [Methanofollis aquaemaris]